MRQAELRRWGAATVMGEKEGAAGLGVGEKVRPKVGPRARDKLFQPCSLDGTCIPTVTQSVGDGGSWNLRGDFWHASD